MKVWMAKVNAAVLAFLLASVVNGCGSSEKNVSDSLQSQQDASLQTESSYEPVTESDPKDMHYTFSYDSEEVPEGVANAIGLYFYAVETQNYDLYLQQVNPVYQQYISEMLQEQGGYSLEMGLEQCHQTLTEYAGTDSFTITVLKMKQAQTLEDQLDTENDFVEDYLSAFVQLFGEEFVADLEAQCDEMYDIAVTMEGEDEEGNALTIMEDSEIMVVRSGNQYTILG